MLLASENRGDRSMPFKFGPKYPLRTGDPCGLTALTRQNMESNLNTNPILPAPGVCRSSATNAEAGLTESLGRHYDDAALNRRRRGATSDDSRSRGALLRCRSHIKMGTFNANTLRTEYKVAECEQRRNDANIEILGVQEHRIILQDPTNIEYRTIGSSYFVISSGWRNEAQ